LEKTEIEKLIEQLDKDVMSVVTMYVDDEMSHYMTCSRRDKRKHIFHSLSRMPHTVRKLRALVCKKS